MKRIHSISLHLCTIFENYQNESLLAMNIVVNFGERGRDSYRGGWSRLSQVLLVVHLGTWGVAIQM